MSLENKYNGLLSLNNTFNLYVGLGDTLKSKADISNIYCGDDYSFNTLNLLIKLEIVLFDENEFHKNIILNDMESFCDYFKNRLLEKCKDEIDLTFNVEKHYDETVNKFYTSRNYIHYEYKGLEMILSELGVISITNNRIYFEENLSILRNTTTRTFRTTITLEELENKLIIQKNYGDEAEEIALKFENILLERNGIHKKAERISIIDVTAGYDIVSYESVDSKIPDKFIEVKNCDNTLNFYFSSNELNVAKSKGNRYYLYLYNRSTKRFEIIRDPYSNLFKNSDWVINPQVYKIHHI